MTQMSLLDLRPRFDGETFDGPRDGDRLGRQLAAVKDFMLRCGQWKTLSEIESATGFPQASISARLRDLRKPRFGNFDVQRRRRSVGTWEYRVRMAGAEAA